MAPKPLSLPSVTTDQRAMARDALTYGDKARNAWLAFWVDRGNLVPNVARPDSDGVRVGARLAGELVGEWNAEPALPENIRLLAVALVGVSKWKGHERSIPGKNVPMDSAERAYWTKVDRVHTALKDSSVYAGRPVAPRKRAANPPAGTDKTAQTGGQTPPADQTDKTGQTGSTGQTPDQTPENVRAFNLGVAKLAKATRGLADTIKDDPTYVLSELSDALGIMPDDAAKAVDRAITAPVDPTLLAACMAYVAAHSEALAPAKPARAARKPRAVKAVA